jgi:hypothetical protein
MVALQQKRRTSYCDFKQEPYNALGYEDKPTWRMNAGAGH